MAPRGSDIRDELSRVGGVSAEVDSGERHSDRSKRQGKGGEEGLTGSVGGAEFGGGRREKARQRSRGPTLQDFVWFVGNSVCRPRTLTI